jgi:hypothetical protein
LDLVVIGLYLPDVTDHGTMLVGRAGRRDSAGLLALSGPLARHSSYW